MHGMHKLFRKVNLEISCHWFVRLSLVFTETFALVRNLHGRSEILAISVHFEKDTNVDHYEDMIESSHHPTVSLNTALDEIKLRDYRNSQFPQ
ncbi:hypothetical protein MKX01_004605 [Papaver californicum]|nr:hypothetical protein MKX01_004605 [Papaver californicum]